MQSTLYRRYGVTILLVMVASLPLVLFGAGRALKSNNNNVRQWIPRGFEEAQLYRWFLERFQGDEAAVASWPGATLEDPRVVQLAAALREVTYASGEKIFGEVLSGPEVVHELTSGSLQLHPEEAIDRLRGVLIGPDRQQTCVIARVAKPQFADRETAVKKLQAAALACGIPAADLRLGGPTVDSVNINIESARSLFELAGFSALASLLLAWACLRSLKLVSMVFATALFGTAVSVSTVYFGGTQMNSVLIMLPTLVFVTTISGAIHVVNYYRDCVRLFGYQAAALRAVQGAWLPCLLSSVTTAIGLGSLAVSQVIPVRDFGIYAAIGVLVSLVCLLLCLPAMIELWPPKAAAKSEEHEGDESDPAAAPRRRTNRTWLSPTWWKPLARFVIVRKYWVLGTCLAAICFFAVGIRWLETSVKLQHLFGPKSRTIQTYAWLEDRLGPLVPLEVVIRFDQNSPLSFYERMEFIARVQAAVGDIDEVGGAMSAATFAPTLPEGNSVVNRAHRRALEKALPKFRGRFEEADFLRTDGYEELWRVSARIAALNDVDYGQFVGRLKEVVEPLVQEHVVGVRAEYTGAIPLIYRAQRELLSDLTLSFLTAFGLIAIAMMIVMQSPAAGLWAMVPNVFPIFLVFGFLGWCGFYIDIGTMMTASVGLGIAVDDTLHYLAWYRRGVAEGMPRIRAVMFAYHHCATSMLQTSLIIGCGLLPFVFSQFTPTGRFGYLMFWLLAVALIGDLLLLPAMLASPIGKVFRPHLGARTAKSDRTPVVATGKAEAA